MEDEEFNLTQVISDAIEYDLANRYTMIPGIILAIKGAGEELLVDVQPLITLVAPDGEATPRAPVFNVPLQMPASSLGGVLFPIAVGDNVILCYSMRGIDTWKYGVGVPNAPSNLRMMDKKDCIAIPCIFPRSLSVSNPARHNGDFKPGDVVIYNNLAGAQCEIVFKKSGDIIVNSPGKVTVNCVDSEVNASGSSTYNTPNFTINCDNYKVVSDSYQVSTGSYTMTATVSAASTGTFSHNGSWILNGIAMETHVHGGVQTGGGSTGGPQ